MTNAAQSSVPTVDPSTVDLAAQRYQIERAWRQIRNGGTAAAASSQNRELDVPLGLVGGDGIEPRRQLAEHEKRDGGGDPYVGDETT